MPIESTQGVPPLADVLPISLTMTHKGGLFDCYEPRCKTRTFAAEQGAKEAPTATAGPMTRPMHSREAGEWDQALQR